MKKLRAKGKYFNYCKVGHISNVYPKKAKIKKVIKAQLTAITNKT